MKKSTNEAGVTGESLDCAVKLAALKRMPGSALRQLWQELIGKPAAPGLRPELIVPILASKLQERAYGGLRPDTRRQLRKIAQELRSGHGPRRTRKSPLRAGTRLLRDWGGETHQVDVLEDGFEYRGDHFASLSEIARTITRTRWSGPLFFGTTQRSGQARK